MADKYKQAIDLLREEAKTLNEVLGVNNLLLNELDMLTENPEEVKEFSQRANKTLLKILMQHLGFQQASYSQFLLPSTDNPTTSSHFKTPALGEYGNGGLWCVPVASIGTESMGAAFALEKAIGTPIHHAAQNPQPILLYNDGGHIDDLIASKVISPDYHESLKKDYEEASQKNGEFKKRHPTLDHYIYTAIFPQVVKRPVKLPNGEIKEHTILGVFMFDSPIEDLDLTKPLPQYKIDTGVQVTNFSALAARIASQFGKYSQWGSYLPIEFRSKVITDPTAVQRELEGMERDVTIMFTDIRKFTALSETMKTPALYNLLRRTYKPLKEKLRSNRGYVDKTIGDAIMLLFGAPIPYDDHASYACRGALDMMAELDIMNRANLEEGLPKINMGVGINTGRVTVGDVGDDRIEYTVIGDPVNLANRVEKLNKIYGTRIIVTEDTRAQSSADEFVFRELDVVRVRGKQESKKVFELRGRSDRMTEDEKRFTQSYAQGRLYFLEKKWDKAIESFEVAQKIIPSDSAILMHLARSLNYKDASPSSKEWFTVEIE